MRWRGFTLVETLVVVTIIALLLSLLMPAIRSVQGQMRSLKCSSNMRSAAFRFQLFAENENPGGHGDSTDALGRRGFYVKDYLESLYRIDEYWDLGPAPRGILTEPDEVVICPQGAKVLTRVRGYPCGTQAVLPAEDVTLAVNMRLYRAPYTFGGRPILVPEKSAYVRSDVLSYPYVPLLMDVDGRKAVERRFEPFYTAPPVAGEAGPYADGRYWMPSRRHNGHTNVAFVGGHVLSSPHPERERWDWSYRAAIK